MPLISLFTAALLLAPQSPGGDFELRSRDGRLAMDLGGYVAATNGRTETVRIFSFWTGGEAQISRDPPLFVLRQEIVENDKTLVRWTDAMPPPPQVRDGAILSVWGPARGADRSSAKVWIQESSGLVADWVLFARGSLEDCWADAIPQIVAQ
jgi:hypothetical protein